MFVAFWLQLLGNSTPGCSKAARSPWPMRASRSSHSIASKGCSPGVVNRRSTDSVLPAVGCSIVGGCGVLCMALLLPPASLDARCDLFGGGRTCSRRDRTERRAGEPLILVEIGVEP